MKRFLTCALCFVSLPAVAVTLWYEKDGACPGLYKNNHPVSGCSGTTVSRLTVTPAEDTTFTGFYVNGQMIVDANGYVTSNALDILRNANLGADSKIPQSYNCASGKNSYNICINSNATYIDFESGNEEDGYEVSSTQLGRGGGTNACVHSKFKVQIHWCPPKVGAYTGNWTNGPGGGLSGWNPPTVPANFGYPELWPSDSDCSTSGPLLYYEWKNRNSTTPGNATYRTGSYSGPIMTQINVPTGKFNGWTLRGFYLLADDISIVPAGCGESTQASYSPTCYNYWGNRNYFAKRRVVTATNTEGTARLGLPKPNSNTETGYVDLNDTHNGANGAWANTRWTVYDCSKTDEEVANTTYHLYAGWAKDPVRDANTVDGRFKIYRTGIGNPNKGDVEYTWWCLNSGDTISNANAYNPICLSNKCSVTNLGACSQVECLNITPDGTTNWCAGTPQCVLTSSVSTSRMCCVGNLTYCYTQKDCESVGGTWNSGSCQ